MRAESFGPGDALLVVDVQNDFCPGGSLAVDGGDEVVSVLNGWIDRAVDAGVPVFASRDWHPKGHVSFEEAGGKWPAHCVQDSEGAAFHQDLRLPESVVLVTKGVRLDRDQNSAFDETGLAEYLRRMEVERLFVGGLAEDVCVAATVGDAVAAGFEAVLIEDATRPVDPQTSPKKVQALRRRGAVVIESPAAGW